MDSREALVALNMIEHVGPVRVRQLLEHFGEAPAILAASRAQLRQVRGIGEDTAEAISNWEKTIDLSGELKRIMEFGCHVLIQADEEYPALLRQIYDPPVVLYVKGRLTLQDKNAVAMVGSRMTTHYGIETARKLAYQLAYVGVTVVSGGARGIDTAAHQGALSANGRTVAVLGTGIKTEVPVPITSGDVNNSLCLQEIFIPATGLPFCVSAINGTGPRAPEWSPFGSNGVAKSTLLPKIYAKICWGGWTVYVHPPCYRRRMCRTFSVSNWKTASSRLSVHQYAKTTGCFKSGNYSAVVPYTKGGISCNRPSQTNGLRCSPNRFKTRIMESEPVLAPAIIFSDNIIRDQTTGKLTLVGVFHRFSCRKTPFTAPAFFATVLITNMSGKIEGMPVAMCIEDAMGRVLAIANGQITASSLVTRGDMAEIGFPIPPTTFENIGQYKAIVRVGDEALGHRNFNVVLTSTSYA